MGSVRVSACVWRIVSGNVVNCHSVNPNITRVGRVIRGYAFDNYGVSTGIVHVSGKRAGSRIGGRMSSFSLGSQVDLPVSFSVAGSAVDPTAVTLQIRDPDGTVTTYTYALGGVTKLATGSYTRPLTLNVSGKWWYRYTGSGSYRATTGDKVITVDSSEFAYIV